MKNDKPEILYTWKLDENNNLVISSKGRSFAPIPYNSLIIDMLLAINSMNAMLNAVSDRSAQTELDVDRLRRQTNANTASIGGLWAGGLDNE